LAQRLDRLGLEAIGAASRGTVGAVVDDARLDAIADEVVTVSVNSSSLNRLGLTYASIKPAGPAPTTTTSLMKLE
jgi:hypothetical protein